MSQPVVIVSGRLPEGRIDELTGDEVTISAARSLREGKDKQLFAYPRDLPDWKEGCVFCPGNEEMTCMELDAIRADVHDPKSWTCRSFSNRFPPFILEVDQGLPPENLALGACELIVETRKHNGYFSSLQDEEVAAAILVAINRYFALKGDNRLDWVTIFKNYGYEAGGSLEHPHFQLVAKAKVPRRFQDSFARAQAYRWKYRSNLCCDYIAKHVDQIVLESPFFVTFVPHAARSPFHLRIFPKEHNPSFAYVLRDYALRCDFARTLRSLVFLFKVAVQGDEHGGYSDPSYNFFLNTAPYQDDYKQGLMHWYLEFQGRTTIPAAYEFHTGEFINPTYPEEIARMFREIAARYLR